ncbi:MAG: hypothetical protein DMF53_28200 [Acidobacteria bacterium]|nr:MAG: hypothetical protein DMF53_28200 [Acidobacteriota bacterium]
MSRASERQYSGVASRFLIATGLPASGKSTVGSAVAAALALPFLDKDEILEALFESLGVGDAPWRARLSRAADQVLERLAPRSQGAVIASWWRHPRREEALHSHLWAASAMQLDELARFEQFASRGALGIGHVVEIDTEQELDLRALLDQIA